MKIAIMQPYFLPYLGYFQLIHAVDAFVVYDDVNFIKGGWINRNFILGSNGKQRVTLPLAGASQNQLINELSLTGNPAKLLKTINQNYAKAPNFPAVFPVVEAILGQDEQNLARFLNVGLCKVCAYLGLQPAWYVSSMLDKDTHLRGEAKILAICEALGATHYVNLPGGKSLYQGTAFAERGIRLSIIEPKPAVYPQLGDVFTPTLSILDVLMFNDRIHCAQLLDLYDEACLSDAEPRPRRAG